MTGHLEFNFKLSYLYVIILIIVSMFPILIINLGIKLFLTSIILLAFSFVSWKFLLSEKERMFLISRIKIFNS